VWYWLLNYRILPSQIQTTGPRGHLTKADVINYINKHNV